MGKGPNRHFSKEHIPMAKKHIATVSWKQEITRAGKEWNSGTMLGGRENGAATVENGTQFLKNLNTELPHDPGMPALPQKNWMQGL